MFKLLRRSCTLVCRMGHEVFCDHIVLAVYTITSVFRRGEAWLLEACSRPAFSGDGAGIVLRPPVAFEGMLTFHPCIYPAM